MCVMKHLLMNPAFPDIVGEAARAEREPRARIHPRQAEQEGAAIAFLDFLGRMEVAATRLW
jgi:hypothetical protein